MTHSFIEFITHSYMWYYCSGALGCLPGRRSIHMPSASPNAVSKYIHRRSHVCSKCVRQGKFFNTLNQFYLFRLICVFCVFLCSTPASQSPLVLFGYSALPPLRGGSASRVSPQSCQSHSTHVSHESDETLSSSVSETLELNVSSDS